LIHKFALVNYKEATIDARITHATWRNKCKGYRKILALWWLLMREFTTTHARSWWKL